MSEQKIYPAWRYNKHGEGKIIYSSKEENQKAWRDSPAFFDKDEEVQEIQPELPQESNEQGSEMKRGRKKKEDS